MTSQEFGAATAPVDFSELETINALGEDFLAPPACIGCVVLTAKKAAEARGMVVVERNGEQEFYPESNLGQAKQEMAHRADEAVSGACKFIVRQQCWRYEDVE